MRFFQKGNSASILVLAVPKGRIAISVTGEQELLHSPVIKNQARFTFSSSGTSAMPITFSQRRA